MWFRNARPYRLPGRLGIDASELSHDCRGALFSPAAQSTRIEWMGGRSVR